MDLSNSPTKSADLYKYCLTFHAWNICSKIWTLPEFISRAKIRNDGLLNALLVFVAVGGSDDERELSDEEDSATEDQQDKEINDKSAMAGNEDANRGTGNGGENQPNRKSVAQMMRDKKKQTQLTLQW